MLCRDGCFNYGTSNNNTNKKETNIMGLDMYLTAEFYVSGYEHSNAADRGKYTGIIKALGLGTKVCESTPSLTVDVTVAYWRKANAIHKWFVDNVQDGVDECQKSYVSRDQLKELVRICKEVIASTELVPARIEVGFKYTAEKVERLMEDGMAVKDPTAAMEKLPTTAGFFFGGTQYDQYYFDDLKDTVTQVEAILNNPKLEKASIYYRSSW